MAAKSRVSFAPTGRGAPGQETSTTRRRIQDVLGQARAALRQSQQFRHIPSDNKNSDLSNKLQFTQQPQEDYWSSPVVGGGAGSADSADKDKYSRLSENQETEDSRSKDSSYRQTLRQKPKLGQDDDFGKPFREAGRKPHVALSHPKTPTYHQKPRSSMEQLSSEASTTSISMSTNELRVSSDSEEYSSSDDSQQSQGSVKRTLKTATTRSSKKEAKLKEWQVPSPMKLTPLNTAVTPVPVEALEEIGPPAPQAGGEVNDEDELNTVPLPRPPIPSATGKVEIDDMGFSRATILKSDEDPHWFEKALLARGETISEAAYKAFKQAQSIQHKKHTEDVINQNIASAVLKTKGKPIFSNLGDPEYTADWISEGGLTSSFISEVDVPISDYIKDEDIVASSKIGEVELDSMVDDEVNTDSMIRTATELEQSGVLDEIAENLHSVLDISDHPESQNFSGMSAEEKSFAKEYDEAMADADEPLQSIFLDEVHGSSSKGSRKESQSFTGQEDTADNHGYTGDIMEDEEDDYDDNTFIQVDSTVSSFTKSKSVSKGRSRNSLQKSSSSTVSGGGGKDKKSSSSLNTSASAGARSSKAVKDKPSTSSAGSGGSGSTLEKSKSKKATMPKSRSYASTSSSTSKRLNSLPIPPDPPTSRHQKNILNLLEKEVYQKELKRIRSEKLREERRQEKQKKIAKESLEKNKKTAWKDPDYTEILLPELFKYKSVSGLQAARAKKSILTPAMNYGAPYFQMNGAISGTEGTEAMLSAARVESLDIPDLVREVLASNERMYRMTVEASEQMAKKAYKDKIRKETRGGVNKKR